MTETFGNFFGFVPVHHRFTAFTDGPAEVSGVCIGLGDAEHENNNLEGNMMYTDVHQHDNSQGKTVVCMRGMMLTTVTSRITSATF